MGKPSSATNLYHDTHAWYMYAPRPAPVGGIQKPLRSMEVLALRRRPPAQEQ